MKLTRFVSRVAPLLLALLIQISVYSQTPQGFTYQAVIRNGNGAPIADQFIGVEITLQNTSGNALYTETHRPRTNAQGVISITIGEGTLVGTNAFTSIPWNTGDILVKVRIDPTGNTAYTQIGEPTELKSVPYALYTNPKEITSAPDADPNAAIFEVKNTLGQVVFGVYQSGVRVYVENAPVKGAKGGFAVGGLSQTKAEPVEYLKIYPDSARVYLKPIVKGAKGGFAVGGLSQTKGSENNYLHLTPDNYFIGHNAGRNNTSGINNSVVGYESAFSNTTGSDNVFIGYKSGYSNMLGLNNVFIGKHAGYNNIGAIQTEPYYLAYGSYNVFIGNNAGYSNISGWTNLFLGNDAGFSNNTGSDNTYIGNFSGQSGNSGGNNAFLGAFSGRSNISGSTNVYVGFYSGNKNTESSNTFIGAYSGEKNETGQNNTFVGSNAGINSTGSSNVFIGSDAGYNETGSSTLIIDNNSGNTPLLWGNFFSHKLVVAGVAADNPSNYTFYTNGTAGGDFGWNSLSDIRLKKNIDIISGALEKVMQLRGVNFEWKDPNSLEKGVRIGFIAQEAEKVIPEVVNKEGDFYSMQYGPITAILVEAIKEQQQKILILEKENNYLKEKISEIETLKAELEAIKTLLKK